MLSLRKTTKKSAWLPPTYSILHSIEHYQLWGEILSIFMSTVVFSQPFPSHLSVVLCRLPHHILGEWCPIHLFLICLVNTYSHTKTKQPNEDQNKKKL